MSAPDRTGLADYSAREAEEAVRAANAIVLEACRPLAQRVALYERTLGLAVLPVLIRRLLVVAWRRRMLRRARRA